MSYADKSIYNEEYKVLPFDSKAWVVYLMMAGVLSANSASIRGLDMLATNTINPQIEYGTIFSSRAVVDSKMQEIEEIKRQITDKFGIKIISHWLPNIDIEKECLFLQCELDKSTLEDFEKVSELEVSMYLCVKDIIDISKYFNMVAMI